MKSQKKRSYFNSREWFQKNVERNTDMVLQTRNKAFVAEHATDSLQQLIIYLMECADDLKRTPNKNEIIGGKYIASRFGGWEKALCEAGLPLPVKRVSTKKTDLYREEYMRQEQLFMSLLLERKNYKLEEQQKQHEKQQEIKKKLLMKECIWAEAHQNDTDEELLNYVRQCASQLGHTPYRSEVLGSKLIKERFGGWYEVLLLAKLPIPSDMKQPSPKKKRQIKRR